MLEPKRLLINQLVLYSGYEKAYSTYQSFFNFWNVSTDKTVILMDKIWVKILQF